MQPFIHLTGVAAPMFIDNVDTDAITPMAAGRSTSVDLGAMLFNNARYHADGGEKPDFVLNQPRFRQSKILVAGENFGCGSSRERAVWSLMAFGIRCVIAPSFADIFNDNAFQNGLLPVVLPATACRDLAKWLEETNDPTITVDLERCTVRPPDRPEMTFDISAERRMALMEGLDEIDVLIRMEPDIDQYETADRKARPWIYGVLEGSKQGGGSAPRPR
jgi:3-isopropylmalate/(R)-2-methylmalate dehydratase small subunit